MGLHTNNEPKLAAIAEAVANEFEVPVAGLKSERRPASLVTPRHVAIHLSTRLTTKTLPQIASFFNRDHTTIISARDRFNARLERDPSLRERIERVKTRLGAVDAEEMLKAALALAEKLKIELEEARRMKAEKEREEAERAKANDKLLALLVTLKKLPAGKQRDNLIAEAVASGDPRLEALACRQRYVQRVVYTSAEKAAIAAVTIEITRLARTLGAA